MTDHNDLIHTIGQARCPYDECNWWIPVDMEYLYVTYRREAHDEFCERTDWNR